MKKVSTEIIVESYKRLNNIWKVGKEVGISGQTVWERLSPLGVLNDKNYWTEGQILMVKKKYSECHKRGELRLDDLAIKVGKNKHQICRLAKALGLTSKHREFTAELGLKQARSMVLKVQSGMAHGWGIGSKSKKSWETIGGKKHFFKSSWEILYANFLERQKTYGAIKDWIYEPETFWFLKIKRGVRSYTPDFKVIKQDGSHEWHEVKGYMDQRSGTKIKRMGIYYPTEKLIVLRLADLKKLGLIKY